MQLNAEEVKKLLGLVPLPEEGGFYFEGFRAAMKVSGRLYGDEGESERTASTAIYYLITQDEFSAMHRVKQDECFHFYMGGAAEMLLLGPGGEWKTVTLGSDLRAGERPQFVVPAGWWQGVRLRDPGAEFALMGATVAPGFEFADFELGGRERLLRGYPRAPKDMVVRFTRG